jgi:glycosyltransferase involved in cell wall biosynthesis
MMRHNTRPIPILYLHSAPHIGGGNKVLLSLFEGLDRRRFRPLSVIPELGPLVNELRRLVVPYAVLDLRPRASSYLSMTKTMMRLQSLCLLRRIKLIHANDPLTYRMASLGTALSRVTRICTIHHPGQTRESLTWAFRRPPSLVLTPSHFMKSQLEDRLNAPINEHLEVVWNYIDTEWFRPADDIRALRQRLGLDPDGFNLTILAALTPHKGHRCFLHMARLVLNSQPRSTFHIVGKAGPDGVEYAESLRHLAADLGIAERVRFWGFVEDELARDLLQASDLFVLPTKEEGFGLSVAEAEACQVPVLTSAIPPLDEVVADGRTGYLLDPEDERQFAERAIELLTSPENRQRMGIEARRWVVDRFGQRSYFNRIESLYQGLVC